MSETTYDTDSDRLLTEFRIAVAEDLLGLAVLHGKEPTQESLAALKDAEYPDGLGLRLDSVSGRSAMDIMRDAVKSIQTPVDGKILDNLASDYTGIYYTYSYRAAPTESVWLDQDGLERQEPMFEVRKCYTSHGLVSEDWRKVPDDHIALQLQFIAHLIGKVEGMDGLREAATFMDQHILRWVPKFARRVANRCQTMFFAGVVVLTAEYLDELRNILARILDESRPEIKEAAEEFSVAEQARSKVDAHESDRKRRF